MPIDPTTDHDLAAAESADTETSAEIDATTNAEAAESADTSESSDVSDTGEKPSGETPGKVWVTAVRFRHSKALWFDPQDCDPQPGDRVIVTTERGTEIGDCIQARWQIAEKDLPAPLKPVLRIADEEDLHTDKELQDEEREAIPVFREFIEKNNVDMKPADVEVIFGREKMIFYFSAEERIDFRQLVRDLAAHFHTRIEMRQVGVRDEARMTGGIGHCGEVLCCARLGGEFAPVSIKMAKDQGLPLNPSKISGVCGRLMCCLRYEAEAYKDFNKRAPKKGAFIDTPRGSGKVVERDVLRENIKLQFRSDDAGKPGDTMTVPLARMCCKNQPAGKGDSSDDSKGGCGGCPCMITPEVFKQIEEESKQVKATALSTDSFEFRDLKSSQDDDSPAVDNGTGAPGRRKRGGRGQDLEKSGSGQKKPRRRRGRKRGKGNQSSGEERRSQQTENSAQSGEDGQKSRRGGRNRSSRSGNRRRSGGGERQQGSNQQRSNSETSAVETRVPRRRRRSE